MGTACGSHAICIYMVHVGRNGHVLTYYYNFARDAALEVEINMVFPSVVAQRPPRGKADGWQIYI